MGAIPVQGCAMHIYLPRCLDQRSSLSGVSLRESFSRVSWQRSACGGCSSSSSSKSERDRLRWARFELRSHASDSDSIMLKNSIEQVQKLRASTIKDELTELGISYADCFEKQELVVRLATARLHRGERNTRESKKSKGYKPLTQMPITRLRHTANSPKNYILVQLTINSQGPFNFILDTGSTVTLIQPSIVIDKLGLPVRPAQQSLALLGGGLSNQRVMSVNLSDVKIGNYPMSNISALLMDQAMLQGWDPSIAGLLGLNILSQFDVEFDFNREVLMLHTPGAASRRECDVQGMERLETSDITLGILGVKVALGRAPPEIALLDLGSSLCIASPDIARLAGVPEHVISSKTPALGGGGIGQLTTMQFSSGYVDISMIVAKSKSRSAGEADFTIRGAQFAIGEIPALRSVGCRILLGVNLFKNIRMIFSQSAKSVYMERPTT